MTFRPKGPRGVLARFRQMHPWKLLAGVTLLAAAPVGGCAPSEKGTTNGRRYEELAPDAAHELLVERAGQPDFVILDVRTPGEFQDARIEGARNLDFHARDFRTQLATLDREATYFVYCRTGNRSAQSLAIFRELGFRDVRHLTKGIVAWAAAGQPTIRG